MIKQNANSNRTNSNNNTATNSIHSSSISTGRILRICTNYKAVASASRRIACSCK